MIKTIKTSEIPGLNSDTWVRKLFLRYVYVLVPISVVLMVVILNWIALQHVQSAALSQQTEISRISNQLLHTVQLLSAQDKVSETERLGLLNSITSKPSVKCARLVFPGGRELSSDHQSGDCVIQQADADIVTIRQGDLALYVSHTPGFIEQSYAIFLRLTLVALLCGLSIAIAFNGLSHNLFTKRDIQKQLNARKAAEQDSKARGVFLDTISHEIRTPLNGIIGMASLLSENLNDETKRGYAEMISTSGTRLLSLLSDSLDLSKMEAGKLTMRPEPAHLQQIIQESVALFIGKTKLKNIELICTIDDRLPTLVSVDPMRLRQVLTNLVSNAVKFTHSGRVEVEVQLNSELTSNNQAGVTIMVRDTGEGITPEGLASIFDRYTQASHSTSTAERGSGLGLSICREITTLMGGTIDVESTLHEGTVFTVHLNLPIIAQNMPQEQLTYKTAPEPVTNPSGPSILLVNNNAGVGHALKVKLNKRGYKIRHVGTYEQALTALNNHPDGLVLANLDQEHDIQENVRKVLESARERNFTIVGMSENPASLDQSFTMLVDSLVVTPGPWDDLLQQLALLSVDYGQEVKQPQSHSIAPEMMNDQAA
ncbi:MAG: ATP-binding protein [Anderseniella sp.]